MSANDFDWALEVEDALAQRDEDKRIEDLIEAHMLLRVWFAPHTLKVIQA